MSVEYKSKTLNLSNKPNTPDFIMESQSRELVLKLLEKLAAEYADYKETGKIYEDFKRLRIELGKPLRTFNDREAIIKDLRGDDFLPVVKDVERRRVPVKRRASIR